jgi:catechol 2,3-dioxygenase-like lactoylglutathione lyase family enzyme
MGFHHVAIATRDLETTHRFYTEATGFELVKVVAAPTPESGWARHLFYDTGHGAYLAIWDIHDRTLGDYGTAISSGLGLPAWANHIAFAATDLDDLEARKQRWLAHGVDTAEIDHGWCTSIYANDPNGIMVEFCTSTAAFTDADTREAHELLASSDPPLEAPPEPRFFTAAETVKTATQVGG